MGSINIFKPLSTFLSPALLITLSDIENFHLKFFGECWESNLGLLGEKQVCYLCAMQPPPPRLQLRDGFDAVEAFLVDEAGDDQGSNGLRQLEDTHALI